jgi:hypothetical protein
MNWDLLFRNRFHGSISVLRQIARPKERLPRITNVCGRKAGRFAAVVASPSSSRALPAPSCIPLLLHRKPGGKGVSWRYQAIPPVESRKASLLAEYPPIDHLDSRIEGRLRGPVPLRAALETRIGLISPNGVLFGQIEERRPTFRE